MTAPGNIGPELINFGCRLNTLETEVIRAKALAAGANDAVIINTCAVTTEAVRQARQAIRRARRHTPDTRIIVTGCAAQLEPDTFAAMPEVDLVVGNEEKLQAANYGDFGVGTSEKVRVNDIFSVSENAGHMIEGFAERTRAFVQIQNGCDHRCTFCIIPFARGNSRSVPTGAVIDQIKTLVGNGYAEVVLTGVDITAYGADLPGQIRLGNLCDKILAMVPDLQRLRLSSIDSVEMDPAMMDIFTSEPRLMPHLHLSLQSGDNLILKRMARRHTREQTIEFCHSVRTARPDVEVGADFISRFPTETDAMFRRTLDLVTEAGLTYLHVFPYSARPGTPAARMPQLSGTIRRERAAHLRTVGISARTTLFAAQIGTSTPILIEKYDGRFAHGHNPQFALTQALCANAPEIGSVQPVAITGHETDHLTGTLAA